MNGYVRLVMNKDIKKANYKVPRFDVRAAIDNIAVSLSEAQYEDLLAAVSSISIAQVRCSLAMNVYIAYALIGYDFALDNTASFEVWGSMYARREIMPQCRPQHNKSTGWLPLAGCRLSRLVVVCLSNFLLSQPSSFRILNFKIILFFVGISAFLHNYLQQGTFWTGWLFVMHKVFMQNDLVQMFMYILYFWTACVRT